MPDRREWIRSQTTFILAGESKIDLVAFVKRSCKTQVEWSLRFKSKRAPYQFFLTSSLDFLLLLLFLILSFIGLLHQKGLNQWCCARWLTYFSWIGGHWLCRCRNWFRCVCMRLFFNHARHVLTREENRRLTVPCVDISPWHRTTLFVCYIDDGDVECAAVWAFCVLAFLRSNGTHNWQHCWDGVTICRLIKFEQDREYEWAQAWLYEKPSRMASWTDFDSDKNRNEFPVSMRLSPRTT